MTAAGIDRRGFLRTCGDVSMGSAVATSMANVALAAANPSGRGIDRPVRIGIVGGGFGAAFQWHLDPGCVVAAVSDLRPERRDRLVQAYRCDKIYDSLEKLILDDSLDAVAVFTEATNHVRHCVEVMNTGKHCISAVPVGTTLEGCAELVQAKEKNGVTYMMAETSHYRPEAMLIRQLVQDGVFGPVLYSETEYYHPARPGSRERQRLWYHNEIPTWRHCYPPMWYPTHCTDFVVGVTGERFVEVSCQGQGPAPGEDPEQDNNQYANPFDSAVALLKTDRGNLSRCNRSRAYHAHGERAQWFGAETAAFMPSWAGQPFVVKRQGEADIRTYPDFLHLLPASMRLRTGHGNSHGFLTHEFIQALREGREPSVDIYTAVAETACGIVAHESALRGGELMKIPCFDPEA